MHVLVDLETMGCGSKAAIVALGAVVFDPRGNTLGETLYHVVSLESSLKLGLEVDAETIMWWLNQGHEARTALIQSASRIEDTLMEFSGLLHDHKVDRLWCHGATFDAVILMNAYRLRYYDSPFSHRNVRCTRTLFELANMEKTKTGGIEHHALDDAKRHAADVQEAYRRLGLA